MGEVVSSTLDLTGGAELQLTGCPVSLSVLSHTHTHPSSARVPCAVPSPALMEKAQGLEGNGCVCFSLSPP